MIRLILIICISSICSYCHGQNLSSKKKPFDNLYSYLVELQKSDTVNHDLLEKINLEFNKYSNLDRKEMDKFRFDDKFWDYSAYPFFEKLKSANQDKLKFNLFEFVLKLHPYYFATGEVEQGLSELSAEIAYLNFESLLKLVIPMDSTNRMKILMKPWWYVIPSDSLKLKLKNTEIQDDMEYVLKNSG